MVGWLGRRIDRPPNRALELYVAEVQHESMDFDVVIVGGGPAGLAAAIRLAQLAGEAGRELAVCLVEKGSEIGAHILSGAIFEPTALNELLPDWSELGAPLDNPVTEDTIHYLPNGKAQIRVPRALVPKALHNEGKYAMSLGNLCRWLGEQAEAMEVNIFPGFAAAKVIYEEGRVAGVLTGDMGVSASGEPKATFEPGYALRAKYTPLRRRLPGPPGKGTHRQVRACQRHAALRDRPEGTVGCGPGETRSRQGNAHPRAGRSAIPRAARGVVLSSTTWKTTRSLSD